MFQMLCICCKNIQLHVQMIRNNKDMYFGPMEVGQLVSAVRPLSASFWFWTSGLPSALTDIFSLWWRDLLHYTWNSKKWNMRCRPSAALEGQKEEKKKQALKDWSAFAQVMSEGKERGRRCSNTGWGHYSENKRRSKRERCKKISRMENELKA